MNAAIYMNGEKGKMIKYGTLGNATKNRRYHALGGIN